MTNPIIRLELTKRFRSSGSAWAIPLAMFLPGLAVTVAYLGAAGGRQTTVTQNVDGVFEEQVIAVGPSVGELDGIGFGMFVAVVVTLLIAILVMVPALVGGTIAGERANLTLQPLQLTRLTPGDIVVGKMTSSVAFLVLIILCAAPVMAIPFLLGGVGIGTIFGAMLVITAIAVELAALSLMVSATQHRSAPAIVVALLMTGLLVAAPFVVTGIAYYLQALNGGDAGALDDSLLRFVASASPISLFTWLGDFDRPDLDDWNLDVRLAATAAWVGVTSWSLVVARRRVTAPVVRDR